MSRTYWHETHVCGCICEWGKGSIGIGVSINNKDFRYEVGSGMRGESILLRDCFLLSLAQDNKILSLYRAKILIADPGTATLRLSSRVTPLQSSESGDRPELVGNGCCWKLHACATVEMGD